MKEARPTEIGMIRYMTVRLRHLDLLDVLAITAFVLPIVAVLAQKYWRPS